MAAQQTNTVVVRMGSAVVAAVVAVGTHLVVVVRNSVAVGRLAVGVAAAKKIGLIAVAVVAAPVCVCVCVCLCVCACVCMCV
jgi:hypothetical protein